MDSGRIPQASSEKNSKERMSVIANLNQYRPRLSRGLWGAQKAPVEVYHLSGIDLDCTADDVLTYCREKGVLATACYLLPRRVRHSTQIAKLFASSADVQKPEFWPDFVSCRPWLDTPPRRQDVAALSRMKPGTSHRNDG